MYTIDCPRYYPLDEFIFALWLSEKVDIIYAVNVAMPGRWEYSWHSSFHDLQLMTEKIIQFSLFDTIVTLSIDDSSICISYVKQLFS